MILHFIRWDFKSFQVLWLLLALFTTVALTIYGFNGPAFEALLIACFIFSMIPMNSICGSKFRSQRVMSRAYLLSLPIERKTMFINTLLRMLVFTLPLAALLLSIPLFVQNPKITLVFSNVSSPAFLPVLLIWFVAGFGCSTILMYEKASSYLNRFERFLTHIQLLVWIGVEFSAIGFLLFSHAMLNVQPAHLRVLAWLGITIICGIRLFFTYKSWVKL